MKPIMGALLWLSVAVPLLAADPTPLPTVDNVSQAEIGKYREKVGETKYLEAVRTCGAKEKAAQQECWRAYFKLAAGEHPNVAPTDINRALGAVPNCSGKWDNGKCTTADTTVTGNPDGKNTKTGAGETTTTGDPCRKLTGKDLEKCKAAKTDAASKETTGAGNLTASPCPQGQIMKDGKCVVDNGVPTANPDKPDEPNKWNDTIAGGKMAIWAALIGFVFGGPAGMMLAAMVGFGAGYFIKELS